MYADRSADSMPVAILPAHVRPSHSPPVLYHVVHQASFRSAPSVIHTGGRSVRVVLMREVGSPPYMWLVNRPMYGVMLSAAARAAVTVLASLQEMVSQQAMVTWEVRLAAWSAVYNVGTKEVTSTGSDVVMSMEE